jgi:hypothetical protein
MTEDEGFSASGWRFGRASTHMNNRLHFAPAAERIWRAAVRDALSEAQMAY